MLCLMFVASPHLHRAEVLCVCYQPVLDAMLGCLHSYAACNSGSPVIMFTAHLLSAGHMNCCRTVC